MKQNSFAILFDLDGTLIDSAADLMAALNAVLQRHARPQVSLQAVKSMIGDGIPRLVEKGFTATGGLPGESVLESAKQRCVDYYTAAPAVATCLFPEVAATLSTLKNQGYQLAVCTNKPERLARHILGELGVGALLDAVVGGDSLAVRKPDPGHLLGTLKQLNIHDPKAAVMVGDSRNDVVAARAARLPIVFVTYGYNLLPLSELNPDHAIDTFTELPAVLPLLLR
jgi:phosphoglycolate phosphatase